MTITITTTRGTKVDVEAIATVSPLFVITPTIERADPLVLSKTKYSVTHVPSTASVVANVRGKRRARLCAAVFAGLPVSWEKIKTWNDAAELFPKQMPSWVYEWRKQVQS
jgi:hypothetical protein